MEISLASISVCPFHPKDRRELWTECRKFQSFPKTTSGTQRYKYQAFSVSWKRGKKDVSSEKVAFVDHDNGGVAELFTDDIICALKLWNRGLRTQMSMLGHELLMFNAKMRGHGVDHTILSYIKIQTVLKSFENPS